MSVAELQTVIERAKSGDPLRELDQRDPVEYEIEIHRRRALPIAPLLFAGVGVPIALASERRGRNLGLLLSLLSATAYYALTAVMENAARENWLSAGLAVWTPNLVFAAIAMALILLQSRRIPV